MTKEEKIEFQDRLTDITALLSDLRDFVAAANGDNEEMADDLETAAYQLEKYVD